MYHKDIEHCGNASHHVLQNPNQFLHEPSKCDYHIVCCLVNGNYFPGYCIFIEEKHCTCTIKKELSCTQTGRHDIDVMQADIV